MYDNQDMDQLVDNVLDHLETDHESNKVKCCKCKSSISLSLSNINAIKHSKREQNKEQIKLFESLNKINVPTNLTVNEKVGINCYDVKDTNICCKEIDKDHI